MDNEFIPSLDKAGDQKNAQTDQEEAILEIVSQACERPSIVDLANHLKAV
jgi:hypothetical protein